MQQQYCCSAVVSWCAYTTTAAAGAAHRNPLTLYRRDELDGHLASRLLRLFLVDFLPNLDTHTHTHTHAKPGTWVSIHHLGSAYTVRPYA